MVMLRGKVIPYLLVHQVFSIARTGPCQCCVKLGHDMRSREYYEEKQFTKTSTYYLLVHFDNCDLVLPVTLTSKCPV